MGGSRAGNGGQLGAAQMRVALLGGGAVAPDALGAGLRGPGDGQILGGRAGLALLWSPRGRWGRSARWEDAADG